MHIFRHFFEVDLHIFHETNKKPPAGINQLEDFLNVCISVLFCF